MQQKLNPLKMKDLPLEERPREKLMNKGPSKLTNSELLAIILRTGTKQENVLTLSQRIMNQYSVKTLASSSINALQNIFGIGSAKACQIAACFELSRRLESYTAEAKPVVNEPSDVAQLFISRLSHLSQEHCIGVYLDARRRIIHSQLIFIGSLTASLLHPREIFKIALSHCAAAVILLHNHPSGDPTPSDDDIEITYQIALSGDIMGIKLLDHLIIGENSFTSLKESGYMDYDKK